MSNKNLQDMYLNALRKEHIPLSVFLVNGIKLGGIIDSFDQYSLILRNNNSTQLIFKHAIATIAPNRAFELDDGASAAE